MFMPSSSISAIRNAVIGLAVFFVPLNAALAMTLTVPYRGPMPALQTVSTTIEFDASSISSLATIEVAPLAPVAAPAISIPVPASSCVGNACSSGGGTPAGDDFLVTRISGTSRVQLQLSYFASFGANSCAYTGSVVDKTFTINLAGITFGAANGYRITSFMAPSDASCDIPYARVPSAKPVLGGSPVLTKLGRLPLNMVLVLDKSPSMSWTLAGGTPAGTELSRWDNLKSSVNLFTSVWDVVGAPDTPGSSEGHAEDRLGLIFFGGTASESPLDGASFFKSRGTGLAPWSGPVSAAINATSFTGGTSIGAGTANARSRLNSVAKVAGDTAIVLFTDGEQNTPPCIIRDGETTTPTTKPYPNLPGMTYVDQCTVAVPGAASALLTLNGSVLAKDVLPRGPIFTIGIGDASVASAATLLDEIMGETAGRGRFPGDRLEMGTAFVDSLVDNLKGGTVSLLQRAIGNVAATSQASAPMQVAIDPSLTRAVFVLSWDRAGQELGLEIRQPNGTTVIPPLAEGGATSRVVAVNLPANGPSGTWQARVFRQGTAPISFNYHLSAYGVESRLSSRVTESRNLGTGQPIKIVAEVGWNDAGLANLPAGAIRAIIERPQENLGNILHQSVIGEQANVEPSPLMKDTSPLMMKLHQLAATGKLFERIEPHALPDSVPLVNVGNGRYEGVFNGVNVGGKYRIRVEFDWNDPRTGQIKRTQIAERQAAVLPSESDSIIKVDPKSGSATILLTLRDRFGNYVGPGYENKFNIQVGDNKTRIPVFNNSLTGTYVALLSGLTPGSDPRIKIDFRGQSVRNAPLSQLEKPPVPPCQCGTLCPKVSSILPAGDNKLAGTGFMWVGMAGVGAVAFARRRRNKK